METIPITFVWTNFAEPSKSVKQTVHWLVVPRKGEKVELLPDGYTQPQAYIVESVAYSDLKAGRPTVTVALSSLNLE